MAEPIIIQPEPYIPDEEPFRDRGKVLEIYPLTPNDTDDSWSVFQQESSDIIKKEIESDVTYTSSSCRSPNEKVELKVDEVFSQSNELIDFLGLNSSISNIQSCFAPKISSGVLNNAPNPSNTTKDLEQSRLSRTSSVRKDESNGFNEESILRGSLKRHLERKHGSKDVPILPTKLPNTTRKKYRCYQCNEQFLLPGSLKRHLERHSNLDHQNSHHNEVKNEETAHQIIGQNTDDTSRLPPIRSSSTGSRWSDTKHTCNAFGGKIFPCKLCTRSYRTLHSLWNHVEREHAHNRKCHTCKITFPNQEYLSRHMEIHSSRDGLYPEKNGWNGQYETHLCIYCSMKFKEYTDLYEHINIHNNMTAYKCDTCKIVIFSERDYEAHIVNHGKKKKTDVRIVTQVPVQMKDGVTFYECPVCRECFSLSSSLAGHLHYHRTARHNEETTFHKQFLIPKMLKDGLEEAKDNVTTFKCLECLISFPNSEALQEHLDDHKQGGPPEKRERNSDITSNPQASETESLLALNASYMCSVCKRDFIYFPAYQKHVEGHKRENDKKLYGNSAYKGIYGQKETNDDQDKCKRKMTKEFHCSGKTCKECKKIL